MEAVSGKKKGRDCKPGGSTWCTKWGDMSTAMEALWSSCMSMDSTVTTGKRSEKGTNSHIIKEGHLPDNLTNSKASRPVPGSAVETECNSTLTCMKEVSVSWKVEGAASGWKKGSHMKTNASTEN